MIEITPVAFSFTAKSATPILNRNLNLLLAILGLVLSFSACADFTGNVVGVADGDTIAVLDVDKVQHKIRLTGMDAPEKKQPFGNRSKRSLSDMVFNKTVVVKTIKRDRYGRV